MKILSWNIQAAQGVDGITSIERIAADIVKLADADIICLQEILVTASSSQVAQLDQLFPEHTAVFGAAIDRIDGDSRLQFGNLILSRLPLHQIAHHKLPQPAEPTIKHMPRQAIEVLVDWRGSMLRVVTTHLDYFAQDQRAAQTAYLAAHHDECMTRFRNPSPSDGDGQFAALPETAFSVYCGDFNFTIDSPDYQQLCQQTAMREYKPLIDCWRLLNTQEPHPPTCGIFDHVQWQEGPHCRDFFFVSENTAPTVSAMKVDTLTASSDHQPLYLELVDR